MAVDSPNTSLNSLRSLFKLQKPLNPSHFLTPSETLYSILWAPLYSSPDLPTPFILPACPTSFLTRLQISPQNFRGIPKSLLASTFNTKLPAQFVFFFIAFFFIVSWAYCDGRVDFIDWAGGDIDSGMLSRVWGGSERC